MARRSSRSAGARAARYHNPIANLRLHAPTVSPVDLSVFEDRRRFAFDPLPPAGVFSRRSQRRLVLAPVAPPKAMRVRERISFAVPDKVVLCVRRKRRREVLFAKKRTRSGAGGSRRRNYWSDVKC